MAETRISRGHQFLQKFSMGNNSVPAAMHAMDLLDDAISASRMAGVRLLFSSLVRPLSTNSIICALGPSNTRPVCANWGARPPEEPVRPYHSFDSVGCACFCLPPA
jgi:hypothetical protein